MSSKVYGSEGLICNLSLGCVFLLQAALQAKRGEEVAAKRRAEEALDEVRREIEREKKKYEFER